MLYMWPRVCSQVDHIAAQHAALNFHLCISFCLLSIRFDTPVCAVMISLQSQSQESKTNIALTLQSFNSVSL